MNGATEMAHNYAYMRIYADLADRIHDGRLEPGAKLPTEVELVKAYAVSRETIRKALSLLEAQDLITRKVSRGTFVKAPKAEYMQTRIHESFSEQMRRLGKEPSSEIQSIEILSELPGSVGAVLRPEEGERVYRISRVRLASGVPMSYEIDYVRQKFCPNLHTMLLNDTSLYELYEKKYNLKMDRMNLKVEAVTAEPFYQKVLHLKGADALLKMTSLMHLESGEPLYYVISYHVGELYEFTTTMSRRASLIP